VAFIIVPLFALANAGVPIELGALTTIVTQPTSLGIFAGLLAGKLVGIAGLSWLAVRLGVGQFPVGCGTRHLVGVGLLAGIGFTMSIFIAELAFRADPAQLINAKTAILFASLIAGIAGYVWLRRLGRSA
jgi:NhaA family Na+:H+ antiporter